MPKAGRPRLKILYGTQIHWLRVLDFAFAKEGKAWYYTQCECGTIKPYEATRLKKGLQKSCGCKRGCKTEEINAKNRGGRSNAWKGFGEISGNFWKQVRDCGFSRSLPFTITIEYIWNLFLQQAGRCRFTGIALEHQKYVNKKRISPTASVDRIDSGKGYEEGNIQWVHKTINKMKGNLSDRDFIKWCCLVADHCRLEVAEPPDLRIAA